VHYQDFDAKPRTTASVLGCGSRKELVGRFHAVNRASQCDVDRLHKWLRGRSLPRSAEVLNDWAKVLTSARDGSWLASCRRDEFARELAGLFRRARPALMAPARVDRLAHEFLVTSRVLDQIVPTVQPTLAAERDPCHVDDDTRMPPAEPAASKRARLVSARGQSRCNSTVTRVMQMFMLAAPGPAAPSADGQFPMLLLAHLALPAPTPRHPARVVQRKGRGRAIAPRYAKALRHYGLPSRRRRIAIDDMLARMALAHRLKLDRIDASETLPMVAQITVDSISCVQPGANKRLNFCRRSKRGSMAVHGFGFFTRTVGERRSGKAFDVVWLSAEAEGHLADGQTLNNRWWIDVTVEERNGTVHVPRLRRASTGLVPSFDCIETVARIGSRLAVSDDFLVVADAPAPHCGAP
jgi:hypothetical protein